MYAGTTPGPVGLNFGQAERGAYKEVILPIFARFMKSCYSEYLLFLVFSGYLIYALSPGQLQESSAVVPGPPVFSSVHGP